METTGYAVRRVRLAALLLLALQASGCAGPGYYAQAIAGQWRLMRDREDLAGLIASDDTDPNLARRLETVQQIRRYAAKQLDLPADDSYTSYVQTGREAVTWNVVATPEFSLQPQRWCFMVAGCVPYRGYFHEDAARAFAETLSARGDDVAVSPAVAYSTLGWFEDPLLDTMLRYPDEELAGLLFHELAHRKLYIKGDTAFNESYASFVEETGVRMWLKETGRTERLERWQRRARAEAEFNRLTLGTRRKLARLYASGLTPEAMREGKSEAFRALRSAYEQRVRKEWEGHRYFASWMDSNMNNAGLALLNAYRGGLCAFARLYHDAEGDMARFHELARRRGALPADERRAWLEQPCEVIAPNGDL